MLKIVVSWYIGIFFLSSFFGDRLTPLSVETYVIFILFITGLIFGGFIALVQFQHRKINYRIVNFHERLDKPNSLIYFLVIYYLFLFALLLKFIVLSGNEVLAYVRLFAFSQDYEENPIFISDLHVFIHRILIIPSIYALFIFGLKNYFCFSRKKILFISIFLLLLDSIVMFGRLNLYYTGFMYTSAWFIFSRNENSRVTFLLRNLKFKSVFYSFVIVMALFSVTYLRTTSESDVLFSGAFNSFMEYNMYGLRIFDLNLNDPSSIIHQHTYGRSLLGQIDAVFSILYRFTIDPTFLPANSVNGEFLNTYFDVGKNTVITANAFGTIFFTLYRDFGLYGSLFFSCGFGYVLNWFNLNFIYYRKPFDLCLGLLLVYALTFSVYQSVFEGHFWPMLFIMISLEYFNKVKFRLR